MGMLGRGKDGGLDMLLAKYLVFLLQVRCWLDKDRCGLWY
jgi:hypothetical protein